MAMANKRKISEMSSEMYEEHCNEKIADFKAAQFRDGSANEAMAKVYKMHRKPRMPDFAKDDEEFAKNDPDRVGESSLYTGVVVVVVVVCRGVNLGHVGAHLEAKGGQFGVPPGAS